MESATSLTPPSTGLSGIQFSTQRVGVIDPEGPEKYNNTEMKSGRDFFLPNEVEVLVGKDKGKVGEVVEIVKERNWCFVEGLHLDLQDAGRSSYKEYLAEVTRHVKSEKPLLVTHEVKLVDPSDLRATDFEWRYTEEGERVRVSVRTGRILPIPHRHLNTWEDFMRAYEYKASKMDTAVSNLKKVTYQPKLCTFEEDVAISAGIKWRENRDRRSYWY